MAERVRVDIYIDFSGASDGGRKWHAFLPTRDSARQLEWALEQAVKNVGGRWTEKPKAPRLMGRLFEGRHDPEPEPTECKRCSYWRSAMEPDCVCDKISAALRGGHG